MSTTKSSVASTMLWIRWSTPFTLRAFFVRSSTGSAAKAANSLEATVHRVRIETALQPSLIRKVLRDQAGDEALADPTLALQDEMRGPWQLTFQLGSITEDEAVLVVLARVSVVLKGAGAGWFVSGMSGVPCCWNGLGRRR